MSLLGWLHNCLKGPSARKNVPYRRPNQLTRKLMVEVLEARVVPSGASAYLPASYFLVNTGTAKASTATPLNVALTYLKQHAADLNLTAADVANPIVTSQYKDKDTGVSHIYLRQTVNKLEVANADINIAVKGGRVVSVAGGFVPGLLARLGGTHVVTPSMTPLEAVDHAAQALAIPIQQQATVVTLPKGPTYKSVISSPSLSLDNIPAKLHYIPTADGGAELAWDLIIRTTDNDHWYDLSISDSSGSLIHLVDWVSHASYNVVPLPNESPQDGGFAVLTNPQDLTASPFGWHDTNGANGAEFTDTRGNNVDAHLDLDDDNVADTSPGRPSGGAALDFSGYSFDPAQDAGVTQNQNIAMVNLFYAINVAHDVHYKYGFTEVAGNFQFNNYGNGGLGGDAVEADAQDGSGTNNANFATPPDGTPGRMQQYVFDITSPTRDSSLDNGVIIHEFGHGVSNRLTGGPANSNALNANQSGSMGEGWSDFHTLMFLQRPSDTQNGSYGIGTYVLGQPQTGGGIRRFPYSYDMSVNPLTFDAYGNSGTTSYGVARSDEVHDAGEIWCAALWDLNWLLINKYGYDSDLSTGYTTAAGPGHAGNKLTLKLVMDAMKLQPANPSFIQARDALIAADNILNDGANVLDIWTAFARRGLGYFATTPGSTSSAITQDFTVPNTRVYLDSVTKNLRIEDVAPSGKNDAITLQANTTTSQYVVTDPNAILFTTGIMAGASVSTNGRTAVVPFSLVTGTQINVSTVAGVDSLGIDTSLGNTTKTITFDGGVGSDTLTGGAINNIWNLTAANGGNVNSVGKFTYANLENLTGAAADDVFNFGPGFPFSGKLDGGGGSNTVIAPNVANTWNLTGVNRGNVTPGVSTGDFLNIQNLTGGSAADLFVFANVGSITGKITGGGQTGDTVDYTAYTTAPVDIDLSAGTATLTGGIVGVYYFKGNPTHTPNNFLSGYNSNNIWTLTANNTGNATSFRFDNFANLSGGTGNDTFNFNAGFIIDGQLDGGGGSNTLIGQNVAKTWNITGVNQGTVTPGVSTGDFLNIQNLTGGSGADLFIFTDTGSLAGKITGGGQTGDTVDYTGYTTAPVDVDFSTGTATLTGGIASIYYAKGNPTHTANNFFTGNNSNNTWNLTSNNIGAGTWFKFDNFANLGGGFGDDIFNFNVNRIDGTLNGGFGKNTLVGPNADKDWTITGLNQGLLPGVVADFNSIQNLTAGTGKDVVSFANGARLSGRLNGGGGNNWLDYFAYNARLTINLATGTNSTVGNGAVSFNNIIGGSVGGNAITGSTAGGVIVTKSGKNTIVAGTGRSVVIGGYGKNVLRGGASDDLIINGRTAYDGDITALISIYDTWNSTLDYADRLFLLRTGTTPLTFGAGATVTAFPPQSTVGPRHGRSSTLYQTAIIGNGGQDWYFSSTVTSVFDKKTNETVTTS